MTATSIPNGLVVVGSVESSLVEPADAPRQPDEGAPPATVVIWPEFAEAIDGLAPGDRIVLLTWLHLADRTVLATHPRGDRERPIAGVFSTRSPGRPNPIGLHTVSIIDIDVNRIGVSGLEAIHGTPVLDIKPALADTDHR